MHDDVVLLLPGAAAPVDPDPALLGQKGAGLVLMAQRGLPVPPAVILPSTLWPEFQRTGCSTAAVCAAGRCGQMCTVIV